MVFYCKTGFPAQCSIAANKANKNVQWQDVIRLRQNGTMNQLISTKTHSYQLSLAQICWVKATLCSVKAHTGLGADR